jgi:hypothetical protein
MPTEAQDVLAASTTVATDPTTAALPVHALLTENVPIDAHCVGDRWTVQDTGRLAQLVAVIAMGQAVHAAKIIHELDPAAPAISHAELIKAAKRQIRIIGTTDDQRDASRWSRDGFLFEAISWIAARQIAGPAVLLKDPHLKSTTQGIDGLMIELDPGTSQVTRATICEDKCSENPRKMFRDEVMKTFHDHHQNTRSAELVSTAASLIEKVGLNGTAAVEAAARVLDLAYRRYRAALAVEPIENSQAKRQKLFKNYDALTGMSQEQRLGATFIVDGTLRAYFDSLSDEVGVALDSWTRTSSNV